MNDLETRLTRRLHERGRAVVVRPDLDGVLAGRRALTDPEAVQGTGRRRRVLVGAAAAVLAVAGVGVGVTTRDGSEPVRPGATTEVGAPTPRTGDPGWAAMASSPIEPRAGYVAVWTGTEVLVMGGWTVVEGESEPPDPRSVGAYDPAAGTWRILADFPGDEPDDGVPVGAAVWTGDEALVLDGAGGLWAYLPDADRWEERDDSPFFSTASTATDAVWTGTEMVVVNGSSGADAEPENSAAAYDPEDDAWRTLPSLATAIGVSPDDESFSSGSGDLVWTGSQAIYVGDVSLDSTRPRLLFAELDVSGDAWLELPAAPLVDLAYRHRGFVGWTGSELVVGGGRAGTAEGAALLTEVLAEGREATPAEHAAMLPRPVADVAAYDPATRAWRSLPDAPVPVTGSETAIEIWTGQEVVVWADGTDGTPTADPILLDPAAGTWREASSAPDGARLTVPPVWTGSEIVVWSGILQSAVAAWEQAYEAGTAQGGCCAPTDTGTTFTP